MAKDTLHEPRQGVLVDTDPADLIGRPWQDLDTPVLLVDLTRLEANLDRMATATTEAGLALRPHFKTHKSPAIARRQLDRGASGVTVATLDEATAIARAGIATSVFLAFQIVAAPKLERAMRLAATVPLIVATDSYVGAAALAGAAAAAGLTLDVWLEIDCGLRRCGVEPEDAPNLARAIARLSGLRLTGMFTHAGHAYAAQTADDVRRIAHDEASAVVEAATATRAMGIPIETVSAGSTPTARYLIDRPGLTEIRPGTYVFNDALQVALGTADAAWCALSVSATVISRPTPDRAVIDAGSKTFGLDRGAHSSSLLADYGRPPDGPGVLARLSEEHGVLDVPPEASLAIGQRLRIVPNHVCTAVNLARTLVGIRDGIVEEVLPVAAAGGVH